MSDQIRYVIEYVVGFIGALFLAINQQWGISIGTAWLDVVAQGLALVLVFYTIYSNKFTTKKAKKQAETLRRHEHEWRNKKRVMKPKGKSIE